MVDPDNRGFEDGTESGEMSELDRLVVLAAASRIGGCSVTESVKDAVETLASLYKQVRYEPQIEIDKTKPLILTDCTQCGRVSCTNTGLCWRCHLSRPENLSKERQSDEIK